eukprot:613386-Prymnesium_polylepis.1
MRCACVVLRARAGGVPCARAYYAPSCVIFWHAHAIILAYAKGHVFVCNAGMSACRVLPWDKTC